MRGPLTDLAREIAAPRATPRTAALAEVTDVDTTAKTVEVALDGGSVVVRYGLGLSPTVGDTAVLLIMGADAVCVALL